MDIVTRINWLIELAIKGMERPYSLSRAADYLEVSKSFLYKMVSKKMIPHSRINNKLIYFTRKDLDEFALGKRRVK
jgi:excisionase family DNA binding protein